MKEKTINRYKDNGYVFIHNKKHPKNKKGYVLEHRLVVEKNIGRYLKPDEMIHHINEIRHDNRINNLKIVSRSEHSKIHYPKGKKFGAGLNPKKGEDCNFSKLKEKDVVLIRKLYKREKVTYSHIAKKFNISVMTVCMIVNKINWKHIK